MSEDITTVILSGGGVRGVSHLGYLQVLQSHSNSINRWIGVSIGCLIGLLSSVQFSPSFQIRLFTEMMKEKILPIDLFWSTNSVGIFSDRPIYTILKQLFKSKDLDIDMTYHDFCERIHPIRWEGIVFCATCQHALWIQPDKVWNLTNQSIDETHSHKNTPWTVWDILRSSISIPVCFQPHCVSGHFFTDGMTPVFALYHLVEILHRVTTEENEMARCVMIDSSKEELVNQHVVVSVLQVQRISVNHPEWKRLIERSFGAISDQIDYIIQKNQVWAVDHEQLRDPNIMRTLIHEGKLVAETAIQKIQKKKENIK